MVKFIVEIKDTLLQLDITIANTKDGSIKANLYATKVKALELLMQWEK